jgi:peptide/nickel transport system substrate-binding protein/oligopeptide transport system substrate-binding protein
MSSRNRSDLLARVVERKVSRRGFVAGGLAVGLSAGALAAPAAAQEVNELGVELPADAAPVADQVWKGNYQPLEGKYNDIMRSMYERIGSPDLGQESLVSQTADYEVVPCAATEWSVSEDGLTWTFVIRDGLQFSDGTPLTAHDFEWTMKYALNGADHVYDFAWYFLDIKGAREASEGTGSADDIGVTAVDDHTLQITTSLPTPYLPQMMIAFRVSPRHVIEEVGEFWSLDPETYVSSGPWTLESYDRGQSMVWKLNPNYKGVFRPMLSQDVIQFAASSQSALAAYLNNEISEVAVGGYSAVASPADLQLIHNDERLSKEAHPRPEFVTYYLGFNSIDDKWPFKDNLTLRQAFVAAVDIPTLVAAVIPDLAIPAYSMLPPGTVGANPEAFKSYQTYDPAKAKALMAEAGYPDGEGFPKLTLWVRDPSSAVSALAQAIQKQLQDNLGIELELRPADFTTFTENLGHEAPLYIVPYGLDYMDQSNLLGIWRTGGRHPWSNADYDAKVTEASAFMGDRAERDAMFLEVERILLEDVAAIFLFHPLSIYLYPSTVRGGILETNKAGYFSGPNVYLSNIYFAKE